MLSGRRLLLDSRCERRRVFGNLFAVVVAVLVPVARFVIHDDVLFGLTAVLALALGVSLIGLELHSPSRNPSRHAAHVIASTLVFAVGVSAMTARVLKASTSSTASPASTATASSAAHTPAETTTPATPNNDGVGASPARLDSPAPPASTSAIAASILVPKPQALVSVSTEVRGAVRGTTAPGTLWIVLQVAGPVDNPAYQAGKEQFVGSMWVFHVNVSNGAWTSTIVFDASVPRGPGLVYGVKLVSVLPSYAPTLRSAEAAHRALPVDTVRAADYQALADVPVTLG
jgi:hypothetical protein